ncbi:hypothetical protein C8J57DRAFT_1360572 [Mycena rebaudengoi]|nr:hypothetical protein C8J57DRAFT_1360572 [Mycena rebaudengoi]
MSLSRILAAPAHPDSPDLDSFMSATANMNDNANEQGEEVRPNAARRQYSACGACLMRGVRCDLKDIPHVDGRVPPSCSNCQEGLKCVGEFADVKAVKLLRRGRRLQQVEAIYGKTCGDDQSLTTPSTPHLSVGGNDWGLQHAATQFQGDTRSGTGQLGDSALNSDDATKYSSSDEEEDTDLEVSELPHGRPDGQPSISRHQYSACGACRTSRVRCELRDIPHVDGRVPPSYSNCQDRGLKCVD